MRWAPRKGARPATFAELQASASAETIAISECAAEKQEIEAALPLLFDEPQRAEEAEQRLRDLEILIPQRQRTLQRIEAAIPEARRREEIADFEARRDAQLRATAKLQRSLQPRYEAVAGAFASLLKEIDADHDAWRQLGFQAHELGQSVVGRPAEDALRSGFYAGHRPYVGLAHDVIVWQFDGRQALYGGEGHYL